MADKSKSLFDRLNGESGRKLVRKVLAESSGSILDAIPAYGTDGEPLDAQNEGWTRLGRNPRKGEIDNSKTTTEMILRGKAILKDGRRVMWFESSNS